MCYKNQPRSLITDVLCFLVWEEQRNEVLIINAILYIDTLSLKENLLVKLFDELTEMTPTVFIFWREKEKQQEKSKEKMKRYLGS